jgi:hypothetical protein
MSLKELLRVDPLAEAEKITGQSYKDDETTSMLGLILHMDHTQNKQKALQANDDTHFQTKLSDYLRIAKDIGFETVYQKDFYSTSSNNTEAHLIMWHPLGILLNFDTFWGKEKVNGGNFDYNVKPKNQDRLDWTVISSGSGFQSDKGLIWVGDHDCREALRYHISTLKEWGDFICPWVKQGYLHLTNHMDYHDIEDLKWPEKSKAIDGLKKKRMLLLPEYVQKAINPPV